MSLHALANNMSSRGRGPDSMLVHMAPQEVAGLQALAMKHGGTLTINPDTGLPEAGFLSSILPMLAGFALNAFAPGLGTAVGSALGASAATAGAIGTGALVGGITGLATGSLSKGLMAGLGAYGGAGLGEGLLGAGAASGAGQALATEAATQAGLEGITLPADYASLAARTATPDQIAAARAAATPGDLLSAGAKSAAADPMAFAKANFKPLAAAAAPIMADMMVPTTTQMAPAQSPGRIREKRWDGRQFVDVASTDASVYNTSGRNFSDLYRGYNGGGIVALAGGGDVQHFAIGDLVKADIDKAYAAGDYTKVNELAQANKITAADVADTYKGFDTSGLAGLGINLFTPPAAPTYNQYSNEQIGKYLTDNPTADIAAATKTTNADPAAVNAYIASLATPFVGSTDTTGGSGTFGIYNQLKAQGVDPNELYSASTANDPKYAGYTRAMIEKAYNLDKGAYALSDQLGGKVADKDWVKFMDDNKYSIDDAAQAFGLSRNEVRDRYNAVKDAEKKPKRVTTPTDIITAPDVVLPPGVGGATGPSVVGGGTTVNPNGTITTSPRIPGIPVGGFTGMTSLRDAYTKGGGSLGYTSPTFDKIEDFNAKYVDKRMTGDSKAAYDYLTGKAGATYPTKSGVGQIARPYDEAVLGYPARGNLPYTYNKATGKMDVNPDYVAPGRDDKGNVTYSMSLNDIKSSLKDTPLSGQALYDWAMSNNLSAQQIADATGRTLSSVYADFRAGSKSKTAADTAKGGDTIQVIDSSGNNTETVTATKQADGTYLGGNGKKYDASGKEIMAGGGMAGYALGGLGSLGGYSDGGRLLKGPGDGVSDSIPATIGRKQQPARLADGEFVVPARIVSELGNGSTDAGAKKLYAMMDRVQRARGKTTGKNKVAANSRADKYLPA